MKEMTSNIDRMQESSDDEIDMTMFEDIPPITVKDGDTSQITDNRVQMPPYKGLKDNHDYGLSDNE